MKQFGKNVLSLLVAGLFAFSLFQPGKGNYAFNQTLTKPFVRQGVYISASACTEQECELHLSKNPLTNDIQPIHLTIQNNSAKSYFLAEEGVEMETVSSDSVARRSSASHLPRGIALKVASLFFWPMMVPSTIYGIVTLKSHLDLSADLHAKSVKAEGEEILPYSTVNRVVFVKKVESDTFSVSLIEKNHGRHHRFSVQLT